jgi:hypothetical protein
MCEKAYLPQTPLLGAHPEAVCLHTLAEDPAEAIQSELRASSGALARP